MRRGGDTVLSSSSTTRVLATLGKSVDLSKPRFSHLYRGHYHTCLARHAGTVCVCVWLT